MTTARLLGAMLGVNACLGLESIVYGDTWRLVVAVVLTVVIVGLVAGEIVEAD